MNIRHGDLVLIGIEKLPEGLTATEATVIMKGSGGNDHTVVKGVIYPNADRQFIVGYLEAKRGCRLLHPEHGKNRKISGDLRIVRIPQGFYELRRQSEDTHNGMVKVVD